MKKFILFAIFIAIYSQIFAQDPYIFHTTEDRIFRDGKPFFIYGQSWAKKTDFTYQKDISSELEVKQKLTELHNIGINLIRIYDSTKKLVCKLRAINTTLFFFDNSHPSQLNI